MFVADAHATPEQRRALVETRAAFAQRALEARARERQYSLRVGDDKLCWRAVSARLFALFRAAVSCCM
jgi:hypothetical protein